MTSPSALRTGCVALAVVASVLGACGGGNPTSAPSTAGERTFAPISTAATSPPASPTLITLPPGTPKPSAVPSTSEPGVDPSADLDIAAPYTFAPLDEALADVFVQAMKSSLGDLSDAFDVGVRSAVKNGVTTSWVIVMRFPDFGFEPRTLLDLAATGASSGGGEVKVDKVKIGGEPVRIIEAQGSAISIAVVGTTDLVMVIPLFGGKKEAVAVITAIIEAN